MTEVEIDWNPLTEDNEVISGGGDFWSAQVHGTTHGGEFFQDGEKLMGAPLVRINCRRSGSTTHATLTAQGARTLARQLDAAAVAAESRHAASARPVLGAAL